MTLAVVLVTGVAYLSATRQHKEYTATASLLFHDPGYDRILFGSVAPASDPNRDAATDLFLVQQDTVAAATARALGRGFSEQKVASEVTSAASGQANAVQISATDRDPRLAAALATTYAEQFINWRLDVARSDLITAQHVVQRKLAAMSSAQRSGSAGSQLQRQANELQVLATLQTGDAELAQAAAVPSSPSSPHPLRTAAIGLFLGLVLAAALGVLRERLDRRVREVTEVEAIFDRPILGSIPRSHALHRTAKGRVSSFPGRDREAFLMLATGLRYLNVDRVVKTILITSGSPGDGKTTVARHLAAATTFSGGRSLLIEADLRRPSIATALALATKIGLSDVLAGQIAWHEAVVSARALGDADWSSIEYLDVLPAGGVPPNPVDLIQSERMRMLLAEVRNEYDLVVIDTPPAAIISDAIPLFQQVDGVIVVARMNWSTRESLWQLKGQLDTLGASVLGVVINAAGDGSGYYGSGYAGYYHHEPPRKNGGAPESEADQTASMAIERDSGNVGIASDPEGQDERLGQPPVVGGKTSQVVDTPLRDASNTSARNGPFGAERDITNHPGPQSPVGTASRRPRLRKFFNGGRW